MAAGIIQGTVTTTGVETIELSWLTDDTVSPTKWYNASHLVTSAGLGWAFGSGAVGATVPRVTLGTDDPAVATLGAVADAAATQGSTGSVSAKLRTVTAQLNTLAGYLDGVETQLTTLHTDLGTIDGHVDGIETKLDTLHTDSANVTAAEYETVAASATNQVIGATGAAGDFLSHVIVSPVSADCGVVTIKDNATTIVAFAGGTTTPLSNLIPFTIYVGMISTSGAWKITTGVSVTCTAVGNFT